MKSIEDRAHEILLKLVDVKELHKVKTKESACIIAENVWNIAEAMQAEAEKRKPTPSVNPMRKVREAQWQPDWSQAPDWANYHLTFDDVRGIWLEIKPEINVNTFAVNGKSMKAPSFGYKGDWKDSLRKRP